MAAIGFTDAVYTSLKLDSTVGAMVPNVGGFMYTYEAGTSTPLTTYNNADLGIGHENTNPIVFDGNGQCVLYLSPTPALKVDIQDSDGVSLPGYPQDNISPAQVAS